MNISPKGNTQGRRRLWPVAALLLCAALFTGLGVWQVKRLAWKEALIARVTAATHAPPLPLASLPRPLPADRAKALEYHTVRLSGRYLAQGTTLVMAASALGTGYWVLVPLESDAGRTIYINRGFVPEGTKRDTALAQTPSGPVSVVGLLRPDEPGGTFLRANHPEADRWYSRDITAMAAHRQIRAETGWFLDAQRETPSTTPAPTPGLTVIEFPNNHLSYALTWFAMAVLSLAAIRLVLRPRG